MKRKFMLLQAIENGFSVHAAEHSASGIQNLQLIYAKEREALNYFIEGNTSISKTPSIDAPANIEGVGVRRQNNYFTITTTNEERQETSIGFLVPRTLYRVGNVSDTVDFISQSTKLYTKFFNIIDIMEEEDLSVFRKDENVIYI